jgi:hypothetical protein
MFIPYILVIYLTYVSLRDCANSIVEDRKLENLGEAATLLDKDNQIKRLKKLIRWIPVAFSFCGFTMISSLIHAMPMSNWWIGSLVYQLGFCKFVHSQFVNIDTQMQVLPEYMNYLESKKVELIAKLSPWASSMFSQVSSFVRNTFFSSTTAVNNTPRVDEKKML